jgi:hypothetical protein
MRSQTRRFDLLEIQVLSEMFVFQSTKTARIQSVHFSPTFGELGWCKTSRDHDIHRISLYPCDIQWNFEVLVKAEDFTLSM